MLINGSARELYKGRARRAQNFLPLGILDAAFNEKV